MATKLTQIRPKNDERSTLRDTCKNVVCPLQKLVNYKEEFTGIIKLSISERESCISILAATRKET